MRYFAQPGKLELEMPSMFMCMLVMINTAKFLSTTAEVIKDSYGKNKTKSVTICGDMNHLLKLPLRLAKNLTEYLFDA